MSITIGGVEFSDNQDFMAERMAGFFKVTENNYNNVKISAPYVNGVAIQKFGFRGRMIGASVYYQNAFPVTLLAADLTTWADNLITVTGDATTFNYCQYRNHSIDFEHSKLLGVTFVFEQTRLE